jgi:hypothetical protein
VVGLIDINAKAAQARIDAKLASPAAASWKDCKVFGSVKEAAAALSGPDSPLWVSPQSVTVKACPDGQCFFPACALVAFPVCTSA